MSQVATRKEVRREFLIVLVVFGLSLLLFSLDWPYSLSNQNLNLRGGVSTVGASRVLAGEVPYRDFWTMYAPGHFYLLALLFRLFGEQLMVEVIAASVVSAAAAALFYRFVSRLSGERVLGLVFTSILLALTYGGISTRLTTYPPALLFILLSLTFAWLYYRRREARYVIFAGLSTGMIVLFKHDVGGYTAIAIFAGMLIYNLVERGGLVNAKRFWRPELLLYPVVAAVPVIPVMVLFATIDGRSMLQDLVLFPLTDFRYARPENYPSLLPTGLIAPSALNTIENFTRYATFAIPTLLFVLGLIVLIVALRRKQATHAALAATFAVGFLLHYAAAHVQINTHIITMSIYSLLLTAIFYDLQLRQESGRRRFRIQLAGLALLSGWFLALVARPVYLGWKVREIDVASASMPRARGFRLSVDEEETLSALSNFVNEQLSPGDKLFVGLHRHDVIIIGDVMIYFLLDRPIATRYHELHPAISDTAAVQEEMIGSLKENQVPLIILRHLFPDERLDDVKKRFQVNLPQIGATELDDFIREAYVKSRSFGPYDTWVLKEMAATQG